jgi:hypothetical protein
VALRRIITASHFSYGKYYFYNPWIATSSKSLSKETNRGTSPGAVVSAEWLQ